MSIAANYQRIRDEIGPNVVIVAAAKTRTPAELAEAVRAGVTDVGYNYVQEAAAAREALGARGDGVTWHLIGRLQSNKINKALAVCDVIQTVDSLDKAAAIDKRAAAAGRSLVRVFLEINIAGEAAKSGISPAEHPDFQEYLAGLAGEVAALGHLRLEGLMTMGPLTGDPALARPYFARTRQLFEMLRDRRIPNVRMKHLSMGMSDTYKVAIREGATMVRIGMAIFGQRPQ